MSAGFSLAPGRNAPRGAAGKIGLERIAMTLRRHGSWSWFAAFLLTGGAVEVGHASAGVDGDQGVNEIVTAGFDADEVTRIAQLVDRAEWKRRQYPPGSKISYKNFGRDRRLPITNSWREALD